MHDALVRIPQLRLAQQVYSTILASLWKDLLFHNLVYVKGPEEASDETSMAMVERLVASGEITAATLVWTEGMEAWTALGECKDMFEWPSGAPPL